MNETVLKMDDVDFSFGEQKVLEGIDLNLLPGERMALVGPNGSGKSTLLKLALGAYRPDRGRIFLFNTPLRQFRDWSRIGYVSQKANSFNQAFPATLREVVASGLYGKLGLFRWMKERDWHRVDAVIEQAGLAELAHRNIGELSGGQQQRAFVARALVGDPDLLVLDEPTVGVDAPSVDHLFRLLADLHREKGISLLLVTHDIETAKPYVDRVVRLNRRIAFPGNDEKRKPMQVVEG
ncbi:MAG: metal ABC transporter ATP-binding protein [Firmicutes bacterium]|uniref:Zinc transport system ATP-binding protein n=1 Tax=Melghirimyces thermohalophilus TaxID=1236220 RepID=A0A1G6QVL8_9BACL|nr:metal ABC transporter ATP-binding protein [Melghirimyces thermohalophilus]MDA8353621.1 metal ABC transporter ATP-binding protein [Bacillota bacterium]SDC96351.1 zinc transport system ATP-binding protein [Melghirimyces thermohalophilus]